VNKTFFVETEIEEKLFKLFRDAVLHEEVRIVFVAGLKGIGKTTSINRFISRIQHSEEIEDLGIKELTKENILIGDCNPTTSKSRFLGFERIAKKLRKKKLIRSRILSFISLILKIIGIDIVELLEFAQKEANNMGWLKRTIARVGKIMGFGEKGAYAYYNEITKPETLILRIDHINHMDKDGIRLLEMMAQNGSNNTKGLIILEYHMDGVERPGHRLWRISKNYTNVSTLFVNKLKSSTMRQLIKGMMGDNLFTEKELDTLVQTIDGNPGELMRFIHEWKDNGIIHTTPSGYRKNTRLFSRDALITKEARFVELYTEMYMADHAIDKKEYNLLQRTARSLGLDEALLDELERLGQFIASHPEYHIIRRIRNGVLGGVYKGYYFKNNIKQYTLIEVQKKLDVPKETKNKDKEKNGSKVFLAVFKVDPGDTAVIVTEFADGYTLDELAPFFALSSYLFCAKVFQKVLKRLSSVGTFIGVHGNIRPEMFIFNPYIDKLALLNYSNTNTNQPKLNEYLSPEHLSPDKTLMPESDVFSLGLVFYTILTGRPPFTGSTEDALISSIRTERIGYEKDYPLEENIDRFLNTSVEKSPGDRFNDIKTMEQSLNKVVEILTEMPSKQPVVVAKNTGNKQKQSYLGWIFAGLFLFTVVGYFLYNQTQANKRNETYGLISAMPDVCEIEPFTYDKAVISLIPKGSIEHLLALQFRLNTILKVHQLSSKNKTDSNNSNNSNKGAVHITASIKNLGARTCQISMAISLHNKIIRIVQSFNPSEILDKQSPYGIDALFRTIIEKTGLRTIYSDYNIEKYLTKEWCAYEKYFNGEMKWQNLNIIGTRDLMKDAIAYDPDCFLLPHIRLAETFIFSGDSDSARESLNNVQKKIDKCKDIRRLDNIHQKEFNALEAKLIKHDFTNEIAIRASLADNLEYDAESYYNLAEAYFHQADCDNAIPNYQETVKRNPYFIKAFNHMAYCYAYQGKFKEAEKNINDYWDRVKGDLFARINAYDSKRDIYVFEGKYMTALTPNSPDTSKPKTPMIYRLARVRLLFIMGRLKDAARLLNSIIKNNSSSKSINADILFYGAYLDYLRGNDKDAISKLNKIKKYIPQEVITDKDAKTTQPESVTAPFWEKSVRRDAFLSARWVRPLWLRGVIAYKEKDKDLLKKIIVFFRFQVICKQDKGCHGYGISKNFYKPVYKFYVHLDILKTALDGRIRKLVNKINAQASMSSKMGYWNSMFDKSFFMTEFARVLYNVQMCSASSKQITAVLEYNKNYVPAILLMAMIDANTEKTKSAKDLVKNAQTLLNKWKADKDGYLWKEVNRVSKTLESAPKTGYHLRWP